MTMASESTNIMVVDDTQANLKLLQEMLQAKGYQVLTFLCGATALKAAAKNPPDLILLDINMPEMNGFEVCERLKADEVLKDIPVIFISALTETADKVKAFAVGGVDYITKPFQFEEVNARVETHLRLRRLQLELQALNELKMVELSNRIRSMSLVHEQLYLSENVARIDFQDYLNILTAHLHSSYHRSGNIQASVAADGIA
jgi:DNA-binding response OmpR family regulator